MGRFILGCDAGRGRVENWETNYAISCLQLDRPDLGIIDDYLLLMLVAVLGQKVMTDFEVGNLGAARDDNYTLVRLRDDDVHQGVWLW